MPKKKKGKKVSSKGRSSDMKKVSRSTTGVPTRGGKVQSHTDDDTVMSRAYSPTMGKSYLGKSPQRRRRFVSKREKASRALGKIA